MKTALISSSDMDEVSPPTKICWLSGMTPFGLLGARDEVPFELPFARRCGLPAACVGGDAEGAAGAGLIWSGNRPNYAVF